MKPINYLLILPMILLSGSCGPKHMARDNSKTSKTSASGAYFQYDSIDYFASNIDEDSLMNIETKEQKSVREEQLEEILTDDIPMVLPEVSATAVLDDLGFRKKEIPTSMFGQVNEIFCQKKQSIGMTASCIPIYRDILIFKKNNKIVGVAKFCFHCNQDYLIGTNNFDWSGNYEKLYDLLHNISDSSQH